MFQVLDVDKSGTLDYMELREAFDAILKLTLTDTEFNTAVRDMDKNVDGLVTFAEFKKYFRHCKKRQHEILTQREGKE